MSHHRFCEGEIQSGREKTVSLNGTKYRMSSVGAFRMYASGKASGWKTFLIGWRSLQNSVTGFSGIGTRYHRRPRRASPIRRLPGSLVNVTMGVPVRLPGIHGNHAPGAGYRATRMLELHRRMVNVEPVREDVFNLAEDVIAQRRRHILDQHVAAQRVRVRAQTPDMQIVNVEHAVDLADSPGHLLQFKAARQSFEKNVERFARNIPGRPDNQQ